MPFRWNEWNLDHAARHGISPEEAQRVVLGSASPRRIGDDKWIVHGRGQGGRWIQVIYLVDPDETLYIIHARPLTDAEKRRLKRRPR